MATELVTLCAPLAILAIVLLFAYVGCGASKPVSPEILASVEYDVHDIPEPTAVVFHWTVDDIPGSGDGGPVRPGEAEGRRVSEYRIEGAQPGEWRLWCDVFLAADAGDIVVMREDTCEFSVEAAEIADRSVRFEVARSDAGEPVVRCAGSQ